MPAELNCYKRTSLLFLLRLNLNNNAEKIKLNIDLVQSTLFNHFVKVCSINPYCISGT